MAISRPRWTMFGVQRTTGSNAPLKRSRKASKPAKNMMRPTSIGLGLSGRTAK